MKILVVSDIHANADALGAVLRAEADSCAGFFCLGDIVGYGPDPSECVGTLRRADRTFEPCVILGGNHEGGLSGKIPEDWFNANAKKSVRRLKRDISDDDRGWLSALPPTYDFGEGVLLSHASPVEPLTGYLFGGFETDIALSFLVDSGVRLCFCGHTHDASAFGFVPSGFPRFPPPGSVLALGDTARPVIVNPGSVGFPRSFNGGRTADMPGSGEPISEASFPAYYAVWDTGAGTVTYKDARYDRRPVEKKIAKLK
jgi:diadenosine tetraphosphatase ApaH/serine/threonine PP2A family protein phosphatase